MNTLPFGRPGRFFRGNIHTHSDRSDGARSVSDTIATYRDNGYDFLAITDHFLERYSYPITNTTPYRSRDFTTILGAELHAPKLENGIIWHILGVGLPTDFEPPDADHDGPEVARRAWEAGAFVGIAHPSWYSLSLNDIESIKHAHAIEVFNQAAHMSGDRGDSWQITDTVLTSGRRLGAFGTDDAHLRGELPDTFGAWTMVQAAELEPDALVDSLKQGHYYTSQGPLIHDISFSGDLTEVEIACSPAASVKVVGAGPVYTYKHGTGISHAVLSLEKFDLQTSWCRIIVVDSHGRRAWSNPIWASNDDS